jgi:hypothetical protein
MDWEGSSSSQGIDTNPAFTTEMVSGGFDPQCGAASAPCPISGSLSGRTGTSGAMAQAVDGEAGHSSVVHDFTWAWVSESGNSGAQEFGMLNTAAAESLCGVSMDLSDHTLNVNVPVKFGTIGPDRPVTTANTLYYIRERIIDNGDCSFDCSVFIDETPNWGAGAWYTGSIVGEDYPASGHCTAADRDIRGVSFPGSTGSSFDYVVDDSGLCDEVITGAIPAGTKCGGG